MDKRKEQAIIDLLEAIRLGIDDDDFLLDWINDVCYPDCHCDQEFTRIKWC